MCISIIYIDQITTTYYVYISVQFVFHVNLIDSFASANFFCFVQQDFSHKYDCFIAKFENEFVARSLYISCYSCRNCYKFTFCTLYTLFQLL